jgi:predicted MPP superfamily phosphohydrolase
MFGLTKKKPTPAPNRKEVLKWAAFSCPHCPFEREASVDWLLSRLSDLSLDYVICLGDLFEAGAASVHPNEYDHLLEDEFEHGAIFYDKIEDVQPEAKKVWMLGNHEDNIQREDTRRIKKDLRSLCDWNKHDTFGRIFRRWKQYPYIKSPQGCFRIGQAVFYHGYDCGVHSDEHEALQMAYILGGHAHRLFVRGHTHTPKEVTQCHRTARIPLPYHYANAGTIGPTQPTYMSRKSAYLWGPGLVVGESVRYPQYWGGPQWTAELLEP